MARIVVVEDEDELRDEVIFNLAHDGFDVVGVGDGTELERVLRESPADIVILDVGLPGEDGFSIARRLRQDPSSRAMGIIMLTAMGAVDNRVQGLKDGADVYLVKPVVFAELQASILSLSRRLALAAPAPAPDRWRYAAERWELSPPAGIKIKLTLTEKRLVEILIRDPGVAVKRRDIIKGLGESPAEYDERRLEAVISRLRRKIEQAKSLSQPIQAAHGVGYAFVDPVDWPRQV